LFFFSFIATASTEISTLSLHDALPISGLGLTVIEGVHKSGIVFFLGIIVRQSSCLQGLLSGLISLGITFYIYIGLVNIGFQGKLDRKSTRLNSSHVKISYAVFCLKKK